MGCNPLPTGYCPTATIIASLFCAKTEKEIISDIMKGEYLISLFYGSFQEELYEAEKKLNYNFMFRSKNKKNS
jgi:hypothetical protein